MRSRTEHRGRVFRTVFSQEEQRFISLEETHPFLAQLADRQGTSNSAIEPAARPQSVLDTAKKELRK
jgi:hypothetical protein